MQIFYVHLCRPPKKTCLATNTFSVFIFSYFLVEKEAMQKVREKAVDRVQEKAKEDAEAKAMRKRENEKYSLEVMMKVSNIYV